MALDIRERKKGRSFLLFTLCNILEFCHCTCVCSVTVTAVWGPATAHTDPEQIRDRTA